MLVSNIKSDFTFENFVFIALMIMKFGTGIKLDAFYTTITKRFVTSLL